MNQFKCSFLLIVLTMCVMHSFLLHGVRSDDSDDDDESDDEDDESDDEGIIPGSTLQDNNQGNQGSPNQGSPSQGSPNQGSPYQGSPNQGSPYQGSPNQGSPSQGSPNQGSPYQGSTNQDSGYYLGTDDGFQGSTYQGGNSSKSTCSREISDDTYIMGNVLLYVWGCAISLYPQNNVRYTQRPPNQIIGCGGQQFSNSGKKYLQYLSGFPRVNSNMMEPLEWCSTVK